MTSHHSSQTDASTSSDSLNEEKEQVTYTGKYLWPSAGSNPLLESNPFLEPPPMPNYPEVTPLVNMYKKKTPELKARNLNLGLNLSHETPVLNGSQFGPPPSPEISNPFPRMCVWSIIGRFEPLVQIIQDVSEWRENVSSTGGKQELESLDALGMKRVWRLTVKIPAPSSGMVTRFKSMLLSMNFEEVLILPICFDGLIGTQYEWRSKALPNLYLQRRYGSPPIYDRATGILM